TMNAHFTLAQVDAYQGDMQGSVEEFERAYDLAKSIAPDYVLPLHEALGISYLHKSEMENEVYRKPGEKCLLPMLSRNKFEKTDDSEKAVDHFLQFLEQKPDEIEVKWLLNYAYMTLGAYPDKVPAKYLIPTADFQSPEDIGRFEDVAPQAGLNAFSMAGG